VELRVRRRESGHAALGCESLRTSTILLATGVCAEPTAARGDEFGHVKGGKVKVYGSLGVIRLCGEFPLTGVLMRRNRAVHIVGYYGVGTEISPRIREAHDILAHR
jgi:hypothetical protein